MNKPVLGRLSSFGRGQASGAAEAIFLPEIWICPLMLRSGLFNSEYWTVRKIRRRLGGSERRDAILSAQFG